MPPNFSLQHLYFHPSVYIDTGQFLGKLTNVRCSTNKAMQQHIGSIHVLY